MSAFAVQCPSCVQLSRVGAELIGHAVACPFCSHNFVAKPDPVYHPETIPVVRPKNPVNPFVPPVVKPIRPPVVDDHDLHDHHHNHHHHPTGAGLLWALALLPIGVPLIWLAVGAFTRKPTVFSFAAPVALAIGFCGLCAGIASISRWSVMTRIRIMTVAVLMAYSMAAVLFVTIPRWIERLNVMFDPGLAGSVEYRSPDKQYAIRFPGKPEPVEASPVPGWPLKQVRYVDSKELVTFISAHGGRPNELPLALKNELVYQRVEAAILKECGGTIVNRKPVTTADYDGVDLEIQMPTDQVKRFVRIALHGALVYYLSVEGTFLTADAPKVKDFQRSFKVTRKLN